MATDTLTGKTSGASCDATDAIAEISPERVLEIQIFGVTRAAQAIREARYHLNRAQLAPQHCTFAVFLGDQDLEPGDVVSIYASRLGWSGKLFTVLSVQYAADGTGRLSCREYVEDVFEDQVDTVPDAPLFTGAGDAITPGARPAAGGDSSADEEPPLGGGSVAGVPTPNAPVPRSQGSYRPQTSTPAPSYFGGGAPGTARVLTGTVIPDTGGFGQ